MTPANRERSKPRLFSLSKVVDARRDALLIMIILAPRAANFSTVRKVGNLNLIKYERNYALLVTRIFIACNMHVEIAPG